MDEPVPSAREGDGKHDTDGKDTKKSVPATLTEFLKSDASASAYVNELINRDIAIPDEAARDRAVESVVKEPELLPRVIGLTRTALAKDDSRTKAAISTFASNVIRSQDDELADWSTVGGLSTESDLVKLAARVRSARAAGDKEALQRAEQVLQLGLAVVCARASFAPIDALAQIYSQFVRNRGSTGRQPSEIVKDAIVRASIKNLETYGAFHAVLSKELEDARKQLANTTHELVDQRDRLRTQREQISAHKQEIEDLKAEMRELAERLADAGTHIKGVEGGRDDELNTLRARFRQLLKGKLTPFVSNAQEALEVEPPVTSVARDRLARIKTEIEGELEWLKRFLD